MTLSVWDNLLNLNVEQIRELEYQAENGLSREQAFKLISTIEELAYKAETFEEEADELKDRVNDLEAYEEEAKELRDEVEDLKKHVDELQDSIKHYEEMIETLSDRLEKENS